MGLLSTTERSCPRGHGPLLRNPGLYGLPQVEREPLNKMAAAISPETAASVRTNRVTSSGLIFVVAIFVCPTCGYVELVDEEKA